MTQLVQGMSTFCGYAWEKAGYEIPILFAGGALYHIFHKSYETSPDVRALTHRTVEWGLARGERLARKATSIYRQFFPSTLDPSDTAFLCDAARDGDLNGVKLALEKGIDPNQYKHFPALFYALQGQHWDVVDYLLEGGADPYRSICLSYFTTPPAITLLQQHGYDVTQHMNASG